MFASLDNVLGCTPRPFEESLVVVGVEPSIDQIAVRACANGLLISLVENGEKVAMLLESVHRLLDPFAKGLVCTVEPERLSRASMVGVNEMTV